MLLLEQKCWSLPRHVDSPQNSFPRLRYVYATDDPAKAVPGTQAENRLSRKRPTMNMRLISRATYCRFYNKRALVNITLRGMFCQHRPS